MDLIKNKIYRRKDLHDQYGGQRQYGISTPKDYQIILLFPTSSGEKYGYEDGWDRERYYYWYTGEGQLGDMTFNGGNKALLEHKQSNKRGFLFEKTNKSGFYQFVNELKLDGYEYFISRDKEENHRNSIKFRLVSVSNYQTIISGAETNAKEFNSSKPNRTERKGLVTSRVGQGTYRKELIEKWGGKCAVTNSSTKQILIASHIVPWSESNDYERMDKENGILLSPLYDALFDRHLISFSDEGIILISKKLEHQEIQTLGIKSDSTIRVTEGMKAYLQRHRKIFNEVCLNL